MLIVVFSMAAGPPAVFIMRGARGVGKMLPTQRAAA
jgi:hypothetical protein